MKKFVHWLWWMVVVVVCVGVLWQFAKWLWPDFFINFLGYGPL